MKHEMLNNNILLKELKEDKTIIFETPTDFTKMEVVLTSIEDLEESSIVMIKKSSGNKINLEGKEYKVVNASEIIMIL